MLDNYYCCMIQKAEDVLDELLIPYSREVTYRIDNPKRRYGQCTKLGYSIGEDECFKITVAKRLIDTHNDNEVVATIIHELLHTCPGGFTHTGEWKKLAQYVTRNSDYNISRTSNYKDAETLNYKYKAVCDGCGQQYIYHKRTRIVNLLINNSRNCTCPKCKGRKFSIYNSECLMLNA